jgi:hypothetical protein
MSGRSFDRRNEIARRRTSAYAISIDVENDPTIADLLQRGRRDDLATLFLNVRPLDTDGGWDSPSLFSAARVSTREVALGRRSIIGPLADGSMLCVLGSLDGRKAADRLADDFATEIWALDHVDRGLVVVGYTVAAGDPPTAAVLVNQAMAAAARADESSPVVAFDPSMEAEDGAQPAPPATKPTLRYEPPRSTDIALEYDPVIDLRGGGREEVVVRVVRDGARDITGATLAEVAAVLDRVAIRVADPDAAVSPSVVWFDAAASDLTDAAVRRSLIDAVQASGLTVGLLFSEAAIDGVGEPVVAAVDELADRGVGIGLREFTGRHLPTARLSELSLQQVTFAADFIDSIESESARSFLRQLVFALKRVGVDSVLSGDSDDLGDLPDASDVTRLRLGPSVSG